MPYSHPYKPNRNKEDIQGHPYAPNGSSGQPRRTFEDRVDEFGRRIDDWGRRVEETFSGGKAGAQDPKTGPEANPPGHSSDVFADRMADLGTGILGTISDALSTAGRAISGWAKPDKELTFAQWRQRMDRRLQNDAQAGGLVAAIVGGVFALAFGITALVMFILSCVGPGALGLTQETFMVFPILMGVFTPLTVGFGIMTGFGVGRFRLYGRVRGYLRGVHDWACGLPVIARAAGRRPDQVRGDLTRAINDGKLPGVFLDPETDTLYCSEERFAADQQKRAEAQQQQADEKKRQAAGGAAGQSGPGTPLDQFQYDGRQFLAYLSECSGKLDAAADEQLASMRKTCGAILDFIQEHPDHLGRVRRFSEYYLPTTRKLLDTALGLGDVEAESALTIRRDITGILYTLNTAFVKLYDTLLQDVSLDVSTEIDTLEAMLRQDGLAGGFASDFGVKAPQ